ncbi:MAG: TRAP transporter small permease [Alphaproteobacteria bacterium]|nr:TRAP transporter small permease [Alphaproteobacteria bacterium]
MSKLVSADAEGESGVQDKDVKMAAPVFDVDPDEEGPPLGSYAPEDWATFVFFWALAAVVFAQFFTRYVLNDSLAWTEEIARYLLICVAFVGAVTAVRKNSHIHVEFFYLYFGPRFGLVLSTLVDTTRIAFFAASVWLTWKVTEIMQTQMMVVIEWPLSIVYAVVFVGFVGMTARAVVVARDHWRAGSSALTRVAREGRHQ